MIKILLDAHILGQRETGNETYLRSLIAQTDLLEQEGIRLIPAVAPGQEAGLRHALAQPGIGDDVRRLTRLLPRLARETRADLVHVTYHGPLSMPTPMVVTIHDVSYRVRPRFSSFRNVLLQNALGYWTARRARLIVTVSEFCRAEIERVYPFAAGRIAVTFETSEPSEPLPGARAVERLRELGVASQRYIFCIGRFQPRKNQDRLARAFLAVQGGMPDLRLVLAGDKDTPSGAAFCRAFAEPIRQGLIVLPGYVNDEDASTLFSRCACFAFPSLYEGFGLPVLEAMRLGAPVVTSSTTALPEVAGDAAVLVDPADEAALAAALTRVLSNEALASALAAKGRARAARFDGPGFAKLTALAYTRALTQERRES